VKTTVRTERQKEQRRVLIALAAALLIHLLIVLAAVILLSLHPDWKKQFMPKVQPEPVELTIVPPPEPPKPSPTPAKKEFFDSAEGVESAKPPESATFESDKNTIAASKLPPKSNEPTPTVEGKDDQGLTLVARDLSLGPAKQPSPPTPASPARQQQPPAKEEAKPEPTPPEKKPEEKPKPTPPPKPTPRPEDSELAMLDPTKPKPEPKKPEEKPKPEQPSQPSRPQPPAFQPQTRVTRLTGGISNQGDRASMASVATPLGRYKKQLSDAIGSRWYYYVNDIIDLVNVGTVQLRFVVRQDGKVEGVRVLGNTSNESLASCSVRSIVEAEIPPMPKDVSAVLAGSKLEVDYSFTIVGQ
jgi:outer membrane biosynthesis protein TonB